MRLGKFNGTDVAAVGAGSVCFEFVDVKVGSDVSVCMTIMRCMRYPPDRQSLRFDRSL